MSFGFTVSRGIYALTVDMSLGIYGKGGTVPYQGSMLIYVNNGLYIDFGPSYLRNAADGSYFLFGKPTVLTDQNTIKTLSNSYSETILTKTSLSCKAIIDNLTYASINVGYAVLNFG